MSTDEPITHTAPLYDWTAALIREAKQQERTRILQIVADVAQAFGKPGECVFITVRARAEKELT